MDAVSKLFATNVKFLCKKRNKKIGELESVLGLRKGFFSRHRQNDSSMSLDTAWIVATYLGVSMDELCSDTHFKELVEQIKDYGYKVVPISEVEDDNN